MTENIKTTQDTKSFDEHADQAIELAMRQSAQRLLRSPAEQLAIPETTRSRADHRALGKKFLAAAGIAGAAWFGFGAADTLINGPELSVSEEREDYIVQSGDGLWTVAEQVENMESVDTRLIIEEIKAHPSNKEPLEDGLQPGDVISHPSSVK